MKNIKFTTKIDFSYPISSWNGLFDSTALGCDTDKKEDNDLFWFWLIWVSIFS